MAEWLRSGLQNRVRRFNSGRGLQLIIGKIMNNILSYTQIILATLLIISILLQHRGTSLGGAFGGEGNVYRSRRGAEKFLFYLTIVLAVLFVGLAVANILLAK